MQYKKVYVIAKNTDRADMLASVGFLKPVAEKKKVTRKKVNKDV